MLVGFFVLFALENVCKIRVLELGLSFLRFVNVWGIGFVLKYGEWVSKSFFLYDQSNQVVIK